MKPGILRIAMFTSICLVSLRVTGQGPAVNQNSAVLSDFSHRVDDYVKLRKQADKGVPTQKQSNSPGEIAQRQGLAAKNIQSARPQAAQGDIFTPQIAEVFRHLISGSFKAHEGKQIHQSLRHAEPVKGVAAQVNQPYPNSVPLQSMPPTLLQNLPELPKGLDYRILNRDLILRDVDANLIVDVIPEAIPPSPNAHATH